MATLGTFDGYHLGHASIFNRLLQVASEKNLPPVAITFHPHPRMLVTPDDPPLLLTSPEEKTDILQENFEGSLVFLKFDEKLRDMTADDFAHRFLIDIFNIRALVVGYDHSFGRDRSGSIENLRKIGEKKGFEVIVVEPVLYKDMPISSSRIRRAILRGEWKEAGYMMGRPYPIRGKVVRGLGRGRELGWPTANIDWSPRKLLPSQGVYSCTARVKDRMYRGMMFIGINMLNPEKAISVEANLFDFDEDIYGEVVTLYPQWYIRDNQRFDSVEKLSAKIADDKKQILKLLN